MKVIKIPYANEIPCSIHEVCEPGEESCLKELKDLIDIDIAEIVLTKIKCEDPHRDYVLIVDEIGKMKDAWENRINWRASMFYGGTIHGDPIVGDVVLCAREWNSRYGECDLASLNDFEIEQLIFILL